jgi:hypothetical protein
MTGRATAAERAERTNAAAALVAQGVPVGEAVGVLAARFGLSERQARRYVDAARVSGPVAAPEPLVSFSVRLAAGLVTRVRGYARATEASVGAVVTEALDSFLRRHGH